MTMQVTDNVEAGRLQVPVESLWDRAFDAVDAAWPWLARLATVFGALFLVAPVVVVVITSFNVHPRLDFPPQTWSTESYSNIPDRMYDAFYTSLKLGAYSTTVAMLLAVPASLGIVRGHIPGKFLIESFFRSPLQVPGIVMGVALYQYYVYLLDNFDIGLRGNFNGLLLAHIVLVTPYMLGAMVSRVAVLAPNLEEAAAGLGAGFWRTIWTVTLPLMRPALVAGGILAFLISFENVPLSLFLVGSNTSTLPVELFHTAELSLSPTVYAASALTVVFSILITIVVERLIGLRTVLSI